MNPTATYTRGDVLRWLNEREVAKAQDYLVRVSELDVRPQSLHARVQGTVRRPYQVDIHFHGIERRDWRLQASCSCPVGYFCKHTAAVLLVGIAQRDQTPAVRPDVLSWIENFRTSLQPPAAPEKSKRAVKPTTALYYVIDRSIDERTWHVLFRKGGLDVDGRPAQAAADWHNVDQALMRPPKFVDESDLEILRLLWLQRPRDGFGYALTLAGPHGEEILQRLVASGRLYFGEQSLVRLSEGAARRGEMAWGLDANGLLQADVRTTPPATAVLALKSFWYVDVPAGLIGPLTLTLPVAQARRLLELPPLNAREAPLVADALSELAPALPRPAADALSQIPVIDEVPVPVLKLGTLSVYGVRRFRGYPRNYNYDTIEFDYAVPVFRYGTVLVSVDDSSEFVQTAAGDLVRVKRRRREEARRLESLKSFGLARVPAHALHTASLAVPPRMYALHDENAWNTFFVTTLARLRTTGWDVQVPPNFRHRRLEPTAWYADITDGGNGWFELDMGIDVDGRRLALAPLLSALFARDSRWLADDRLARIDDAEAIELRAADGLRLQVPAGRLKPLARTLIDLFDVVPTGALRLPVLDAPRLAALADSGRWQFRGMDDVQQMAERLQATAGVTPVAPPRGFTLALRPYQRDGLSWLQYLRTYGLAGILADDMGLGKTAQTLAHLLLEKEAGRLDRPALIVLPTSLVHNWKHEVARFAPALSVLVLQGSERSALFAQIPRYDIVLTTYPLLWRDEAELTAHDYHFVILDEAQTVKNGASRAAAVVRKLNARHRLCLTGTPLENHLGELWAQFDFLLPGFLGDAKRFARHWRTPIEKHGDQLRRDLLARRLRPFILRRRKDQVATELPNKTVIVQTVELQAGQRDLYEAVRSSMDKKVRDAVAGRGFNRSHILILDALLKLRQVCCDPRLLKTAAAARVKERAKLALLMGMLPELVDEGRRILVFSQFTGMLALIEQELTSAQIPFAVLTGQTKPKHRESTIRRFQQGEVPVFLISLKAGGVGLNLTAADTVIHYDPWWNPAAENQATDRAHRLGQDKPVFVYKLIVAGSIEEKILTLQEKKAELAAGILAADGHGTVKFDETELAALLAPLPG
ncbi:MAG: DEAD/DEAH box helicase [Gammaproteobacteria bacterium]|nr:DEAD/DEAH box helicase [Gammaproteobacteria bacterium]